MAQNQAFWKNLQSFTPNSKKIEMLEIWKPTTLMQKSQMSYDSLK